MARKYVRDNRGRFASVGATSRGGRLRTAAGNKRATQTRRINAKPANTIAKPKGLQPGTIKPRARRSPATSTLRPGELMNANARPVNTMAKPKKAIHGYGTNRNDNVETFISDIQAGRVFTKANFKRGGRAIASATTNPSGNFEVNIHSGNKWYKNPARQQIQLRREGWLSTSDPRGIAFHEIAHAKFGHRGRIVWPVVSRLKGIAGRVSKYAQANPNEFVAETYAGLKTGRRYDHEVMRAYRRVRDLPARPPARRRSRIRRKP